MNTEKINRVITVDEKAGLKESLLFMKLYTGYIKNDIKILIINGSKYINNAFTSKNRNVKIKKYSIYGLYFKYKPLIISPHTK